MKGKDIFIHLSKSSANKKGLTLIELIVSVAILVMVTEPFLRTIVLSTRNNAYSEQILKASELAQKVMEEIKSDPVLLMNEAVYEADAQTTDYKEYLQEDNYRVMYKITKNEGVVSPSSDTYDFEDIPPCNLSFSVNSGSVYLNSNSYILGSTNPVSYYLEISGADGVYNYNFYNDNSYLQSGTISNVTGTDPIKIKVEYLNNSTDIFKLNVNLDNINDDERNVIFYVVDDEKDAIEIKNTGTRMFYQFDEVSPNKVEYYNVLFKIELVVYYKDQELNRVLSYVKKIRWFYVFRVFAEVKKGFNLDAFNFDDYYNVTSWNLTNGNNTQLNENEHFL